MAHGRPIAEQLGWVRDQPGRATGYPQCRPGRCYGIEDVIDARLLARQAKVIGQDDARSGQQLPAPAHVDLLTVKGAPARQAKLTSG